MIGSIIGIIIIIGGINLYRAFALYKIEKSFNVLNGVVPDFSKVYTEEILHGADPVLDQEGELVPVKIDDAGNVTKANVKEKWYEYGNKEWANAVILTENGKKQNYKDNQTISESDIESYFVWIPKYRYKLFDMGTYSGLTTLGNKNNKVIEIEFGLEDTKDASNSCVTPMNTDKTQGLSGGSGQCGVGEWMTHPAFISFGVNGLWVGKFETSNNSGIQIKPNMSAWVNITIGNSFNYANDYKIKLLSHMMKNTEWGAAAYLTQSKYGRCNGTTCTEVAQNKNSNYITGMVDTTTAYPNSQNASTTGNNSGIFDMSGGATEHVMGVMKNQNNNTPMWGASGLSSIEDKRYYDLYDYQNNSGEYWNKRILGDATGELGPFGAVGSARSSSYFGDHALFVGSDVSWFYRDGAHSPNSLRGIFAFDRARGGANYNNTSFRIVLAPQ